VKQIQHIIEALEQQQKAIGLLRSAMASKAPPLVSPDEKDRLDKAYAAARKAIADAIAVNEEERRP
jgi:hypothetical protein